MLSVWWEKIFWIKFYYQTTCYLVWWQTKRISRCKKIQNLTTFYLSFMLLCIKVEQKKKKVLLKHTEYKTVLQIVWIKAKRICFFRKHQQLYYPNRNQYKIWHELEQLVELKQRESTWVWCVLQVAEVEWEV